VDSVSDRRGRWVAEFVLVVVGVLAAFGIDNWRQSRTDVSVERHLLEGIAADLDRDRSDLEGALGSVQARLAAADDLLRLAGDPDVGVISVSCPANPPVGLVCDRGGGGTPALSIARSLYPLGSLDGQQAIILASHFNRFDVSSGAYSEARASGQLELIRDVDLRSAIAAYYYAAVRLQGTIDDRLSSAAPRLIVNLEQAGLSPGGRSSDDQIAAALRRLPALVANLKNVRYSAATQMGLYYRAQDLTEDLRGRVAEALSTPQAVN
jgi:hypothetical protein